MIQRWENISLDWIKLEEKPNKKISIEGRVLLEFKSKIEALEQQLTKNQEILNKLTNEANLIKEKLAGRERSLMELTERKSLARKSLDEVKEEKLQVDIEVAKLKTDKSKLEVNLTEAIAKITILENQLKNTAENFAEMEEKILIRDKEIQNKGEEILNKAKELLNKEKEIQDLKDRIDHRKKEVDFLKEKLDVEKNKTKEQIEKFNSFNNQMSNAIIASKVIEKIKKLMEIKGFLSDKELEQMLSELEE